jgi:hypothetical protein
VVSGLMPPVPGMLAGETPEPGLRVCTPWRRCGPGGRRRG